MTRRHLIQSASVMAFGPALRTLRSDSANNGQIDYRDYPRCFPDYIRSLARDAYDLRSAALDRLKTIAAIRRRQQWARETFLELIGRPLETAPLAIRTTGSFARHGYRVDKLVYQSRPGEWITANLYVPVSGTPPYPGVLFQCGHSVNGKAADTYQRCCQGLAQLGFLVLTFDPIGQGERTNYPGPNGLTKLGSADLEHTVPGRQFLLLGETMSAWQLQDAIRSLDVLAAHPFVDRKRLASAGQSGGATLTMMLAAVDDRLTAAVVSSGNTENVACADFWPPGSVDDAEQNFVASGLRGFDRWDLLWPFAPRPLLIMASEKDWFGTYSPSYSSSGREEFARLKRSYGALGHESHLDYRGFPFPHGLTYSQRLELDRWLLKFLAGSNRAIESEPPGATEPDHLLWATSSGSAATDLASRTPFAVARHQAHSIRAAATTPDLKTLLGLVDAPQAPRLTILSSASSANCKILAAEVATAQSIWVPMWIFEPERASDQILFVLDPLGRDHQSREGQAYQRLAARMTVCAPDLRGFGDLRPEYSPGAPAYASEHETDEAYAWSSLIFGKSLLGQRVTDLLTVITAVRAHFAASKTCALVASGPLTITALCAAALEPAINMTVLTGHLISWRNICEIENYSHPFSDFVFNALRHTDLPQIAQSLAPRKLVLLGCLDAAQKPVPPEFARTQYPGPHIEIPQLGSWEHML